MGISSLHLIKMGSLLLISLTISMAVGQTPPHPTEDGIACEECVREMHRFGQLIHDGREAMAGYLAENYCPTLENMHRIALRTWPDTTLTWSTLSLTGSSLESKAPSTCASPWAPAGLSRSSPVRSASKEWSGLRLTWKTPSSRLRQLSSWSSTGAPQRGRSASRPSSTTSSRCTSWSWRGSWCRRTSATTRSPPATRTGPPTLIPPRVLTQPTLTPHIQECKTCKDLFQINIQICCTKK